MMTNVNEVRSFFGLARYYRRFVEGFVSVTSTLEQLLRKDVRFRQKFMKEVSNNLKRS